MLKSHFNLQREDGEEAKPEEEQETVPPTPEEEIPDRMLHRSEISVRLCMLGKTAEGDGYTYLKADLRDLGLTNIIEIKSFVHLMYVDVSNNFLDNDALQAVTELPFLLLIQADNNRLTSAALKNMKYLQVIIMNDNQITTVEDVFQEQMSTVEVGNNKIEKIDFKTKMPTIRVLDFRNNLLKSLDNLDFPHLDSLYVAGNKITSLVGIGQLPSLRVLHARNNPIKSLNGFENTLKKLKYINLRNSKVASMSQIKKLRILPLLETLMLKGTPLMGGAGEEKGDQGEEDNDTRVEVAAILPRLKRLNKQVITEEERTEAKELMKQWWEEGEKDDEDEEEAEEELTPEEPNVGG